jgi:hypothetical protein
MAADRHQMRLLLLSMLSMRQGWRCCAAILLAAMCALAAAPICAGGPERVAEPGAQDRARLDRGRLMIRHYLANDDARSKFQTVPGKLGALRAIMKIEAIRPGRKDLLEALGIVLGDTFVQDMGFHWVVLDDALGSHLAIRYRRSNIFLDPLTMIAERVQHGEQVDVLDLYNEAAAGVEERAGDVPPPAGR